MTIVFWRLLLGLSTLSASEREWLGSLRVSAETLADIGRRASLRGEA